MQRISVVLAGACVLTGICLTFGGDDPDVRSSPETKKATAKDAGRDAAGPDQESGKAQTPSGKAESNATKLPAKESLTADEQAILSTLEDFVAAYTKNDAKLTAACFTENAEYIGQSGVPIQGRDALESCFAEFFTAHPGCEAEVLVKSLRMVGPGVAVEDGMTTVLHADTRSSAQTHYTAVHMKVGDKWLIASVRDHDPKKHQSHEERLAQLQWMRGDWVDEHQHSVVSFSCQPCDNGKFLMRSFTMNVEGKEALTGTQRIGWDPLSGQLRTWIFDSEGGYADGIWYQDGDVWILKLTGVTADGKTASGTSIYRIIDDHTMKWQAVDHVIDGVPMPDSPEFTLVRKLESPNTASAK
jgi:uncharacterized protein (TIGR02246 family)